MEVVGKSILSLGQSLYRIMVAQLLNPGIELVWI